MRSFILMCSFLAVACLLFSPTEADSRISRLKRSLSREKCPENTTSEQCKTWAAEKSKKENVCVRHEVVGDSIEWADCGRVKCGENTREVPADLSKAYPDCCPHCEVIDPSKPASSSATGK